MPPLYWKISLRPPSALVGERDQEARVEERQLSKAARQDVVLEVDEREDARVRLEAHLRAGLVGVADRRQRRDGHARAELLEVDVALALDLHLEPFAHGVDGADADAVEARGDLVTFAWSNFPARVEHGHDDLGGAHAAVRHDAHRNAAPVVVDRDGPIEVDRDVPSGSRSRPGARRRSCRPPPTTRWCRPEPSCTSPMYMPGRLRTASSPSRTVMLVLS